jgi:hypothetical protein
MENPKTGEKDLSPEELQLYKKQLEIIFGAICDGFRQEVRYRQLKMLQFKNEKSQFLLGTERERGIVNIMAFYIRTTGFLVRVENYLSEGDARITPDLLIWLPVAVTTDFILEVKQVKAIGSGEKLIKDDLSKLRSCQGNDRFNGILVFGFAKTNDEHVKLENKYREISELIQNRDFGKIGPKTVSFTDIDYSELKSAMIGLWYRRV